MSARRSLVVRLVLGAPWAWLAVIAPLPSSSEAVSRNWKGERRGKRDGMTNSNEWRI
jgi:hypothetical protein